MKRGLVLMRRIARAMLGLGDYEAYCRHMADHHAGAPIMTRAQFFRNRQDARYGGAGTGKCC